MKKLFVLFTALALVVAFTLPAAAADAASWAFYGSSRIATFYSGVDGDLDTDNFDLDLQGNARIGARVKNGAISGRFEYGSGPNLRLLYGSWDFGGGSFLVGQTYTPVNMFYSNQVFGGDSDLLNVGGVYGGRNATLQLSMGGFKVALLDANDSDLGTDTASQAQLPKIELAYGLNAGPVALAFQGGAQSWTVDPDGIDENVTAYVAAIGAKFNAGPVVLSGNAFYGQNVGNYGLWHNTADDAVVVGGGIEDTTSIGFIGVATFKATDMLAFELGGGYTVSENDDVFVSDDDEFAYYGQAVVTLAPGFFIVPEIGGYNYGDGSDGADQGDSFYVGAKWQINF